MVETKKNCVSGGKLAQTFSVHFKPYVRKVLKEERRKCCKKQKVPEWSEKKKSRQKLCSGKLSRTLMKPSYSVKVVIDDESYFPFGHNEMPGNDIFFAKDIRHLQKKISNKTARLVGRLGEWAQ